MKRLFFLIVLFVTTLQGAAYAQSFEQVVQQFKNKKGAEVMKVPGSLMKIVFAFVNDDKKTDPEAKEFIKRISSVTLLDMSECSNADKEDFATAMKSVQIDDFEAIEVKDLNTARLFFHKGEKKKNDMIMAIYDGKNYSLVLMRGRFDEEMATIYAASKQDNSK